MYVRVEVDGRSISNEIRYSRCRARNWELSTGGKPGTLADGQSDVSDHRVDLPRAG